MSNTTNLQAYSQYCEMGSKASAAGKNIEAAMCYRNALKYSEKLLSSEIDETLRERLLYRKNILIDSIRKLEKKGNVTVSKTETNKSQLDESQEETEWFTIPNNSFKLKDIKGLDEVKKTIQSEIILPLKDPQSYFTYLDSVESRILLYGPPGTGKTFIAKSIAGELNWPFANIVISKILDKYVGVAERKIHEIFDQARKLGKAVIFFDEIDGICSDRDSGDSRNTKSILISLLTEMDGVESNNNNIVIIAGTNKPWNLDSALKRGGRFNTHLYVGLPDLQARYGIVEKAFRLSNGEYVPTEGGANKRKEFFVNLSKFLDGYGGGDIVAICDRIKKSTAYEYSKLRENNKKLPPKEILLSECQKMIKGTLKTVTPEIIKEFEDYKKGVKK